MYVFFVLEDDNTIRGGGRSIMQLLRSLERYTPILVTNRSGALTNAATAENIEIEVIPLDYPLQDFSRKPWAGKAKAVFEVAKFNAALFQLVRRRRPRVLLCDATGGIFCMFAALATRCPLFLYIRGEFRRGRLRWFHRCTMRAATKVIAISANLEGFLLNEGGRTLPGKVTQIYNSIDVAGIERFCGSLDRSSAKAALGLPGGQIAVGVIGTLEPGKRQLELIRHVASISGVVGPLAFHIIGSDEHSEYAAECRAAADGNPAVIFVGYKTNMYLWYRALDFVCHPSASEGVPRVVLEAGAFGIPVIAFDIAGCRETIEDGRSGYLVRTFPELLSRATQIAVDPVLRGNLGLRAHELVRERFASTSNSLKLECLFDRYVRP